MSSTSSQSQNGLTFPQKAGIALLLAIVLGFLFRGFLWQVVQALMLNVVPIFFTPVILELLVGFTGLFIVLLFCHLRKKNIEDEWVEFSAAEIDAAKAIETPKTADVKKAQAPRIDEVLMAEVAGLAAKGDFKEAYDQLLTADEETMNNPAYVRQRMLVLLQLEDWSKARGYSRQWPAAGEMLALVCVDAARFFIKQKPKRKDAATECLEIGKGMSVGAVANAIDSEGALQKLA